MCILRGQCVCDMCDTWDNNVSVVFELGRCLVPPRFLQLVKQRFMRTKRWSYVQPLYKELYATPYGDIHPDTALVHSSGTFEDQKCPYTLSPRLKQQALSVIMLENK